MAEQKVQQEIVILVSGPRSAGLLESLETALGESEDQGIEAQPIPVDGEEALGAEPADDLLQVRCAKSRLSTLIECLRNAWSQACVKAPDLQSGALSVRLPGGRPLSLEDPSVHDVHERLQKQAEDLDFPEPAERKGALLLRIAAARGEEGVEIFKKECRSGCSPEEAARKALKGAEGGRASLHMARLRF